MRFLIFYFFILGAFVFPSVSVAHLNWFDKFRKDSQSIDKGSVGYEDVVRDEYVDVNLDSVVGGYMGIDNPECLNKAGESPVLGLNVVDLLSENKIKECNELLHVLESRESKVDRQPDNFERDLIGVTLIVDGKDISENIKTPEDRKKFVEDNLDFSTLHQGFVGYAFTPIINQINRNKVKSGKEFKFIPKKNTYKINRKNKTAFFSQVYKPTEESSGYEHGTVKLSRGFNYVNGAPLSPTRVEIKPPCKGPAFKARMFNDKRDRFLNQGI